MGNSSSKNVTQSAEKSREQLLLEKRATLEKRLQKILEGNMKSDLITLEVDMTKPGDALEQLDAI